MLILTSRKKIPARLVIYDIALRNGSTTTEDREASSPYDGLNLDVMEKSSNASASLLLSLSDYDMDFTAEKVKPTYGPYIKRTDAEKELITNYLLRLEDIDRSWIQKWLENAMYHIRYNKEGTERYERQNSKAQNMVQGEDDDEGSEESELAVEEENCDLSMQKLSEYHKLLPYYIKRLSMLGAENGIHMMSLVIAYEKAKYARLVSKKKGNNDRPKQSELLAFDIFKGDRFGGYISASDGQPFKLYENKNVFTDFVYPFITGTYKDDTLREYYKDYIQLLKICDKLRIDLTQEDPKEFTSEFISDLAVTYIVSNKEYLTKMNKYSVQTEISNIRLSDFNTQTSVVTEAMSLGELVKYNIMKLNITNTSTCVAYRESENVTSAYYFVNCYNKIYNTHIDITSSDTKFVEGFLADKDMNVIIFDGSTIISRDMIGVADFKFMIHKSGLFVLLTDVSSLYFLVPELYNAYIRDFMTKAEEEEIPISLLKTRSMYIISQIKGRQYPKYKRHYGFWKSTM